MSSRPRLKSHTQPLRRGPGSLQLGLCPDSGVVLDGLSDAEIAIAEGLDGSLDVKAVYAVAAARGVPGDRVCALLTTLAEHHLLVDTTERACLPPTGKPRGHPQRLDVTAQAIAGAYALAGDGFAYVAARSTQHVVVSGEGDLPCALADLLRAGGIGEVNVGANAVDTLDLELRARPARQRSRLGPTVDIPAGPDLVVLTGVGAVRAESGQPWLRRGIPHLPVVAQGHRVQVGPLITGSPGDAGPCLLCMDLHRRDRDPAWPAVLSQLSPTWPLRPEAPVNLESTLTALSIGVAAMIVHTCLDGRPVPGDLSLELSLAWPAIVSRRWFRHPLCDCAAARATMAG